MELVCYTHEGWQPRIRAASSRRDWMDDTPERFAYRCLPLAIANAHGWEILSPCGFEARWDGGSGTENVEIRLDPNTEPRRAPISLFGQGVMTFHIEGLIRTSPGWNLWVSGPANGLKDGIAPLAGIVETDWSPYTFTMNWRFTRPGSWVRFEENEPFCFFFPVERGRLAGLQPQLRPIAEDPELMARFDAWSRSRDAFQEWVSKTDPKAPAAKWQKLYYRGVHPDGTDGPSSHESKLRLAPFRRLDGTEMETAECPMRRTAGSSEAPAGFARILEAPPPGSAADAERIRRYEWLLETMERQRGLSEWHRDIQRIRNVDAEDFLDGFYAPGRPVVIEGAMEDWPALERWTPEHLRRVLGETAVEYQGGRDSSADYELHKDRHKSTASMAEFLDLAESRSANDAYITAYNNDRNAAALAPLDADIGTPPAFLTSGMGMKWIGPAGTFTPLHFDLTNNLLAQVTGRKQIVLLPPSETRHLAHSRHVFSDMHDITDEVCLRKYPAARRARRYEIELRAGEMLFVPIGWWHQVRSLEFSTMLTFTNFIWANESFRDFV